MKKDNIPGFPGYYISKRGNLWSRYKGKTMSHEWIKKKFYLSSTNGRYRTSLIHEVRGKIKMNRYKLVALVWIQNPNHYKEVCHIDNDPTNDSIDNLYWGTHKDNMQQMIRDGRWFTPFKTGDNPILGKRGWQINTNITEVQFRNIIRLRTLGKKNLEIIKELGLDRVTSPTISKIWKKYKEGYYKDVL